MNVLRPAVNVAPLLVQLPCRTWLNVDAPNVVPDPSTTLPLKLMVAAAVAEMVPEVVNVPATVVVVAGIVLVPLVLSVRLPYVSAVTVCAVP